MIASQKPRSKYLGFTPQAALSRADTFEKRNVRYTEGPESRTTGSSHAFNDHTLQRWDIFLRAVRRQSNGTYFHHCSSPLT